MGAFLVVLLITYVVYETFKKPAPKREKYDFRAENRIRCQKTNARLEAGLVKKYLLQNMVLPEAIKTAREEVAANGFVPCVPQKAFEQTGVFQEADFDRYNAEVVRERIEVLKKEYLEDNPGKTVSDWVPDEEDLYQNFPNENTYSKDNARWVFRSAAFYVGDVVECEGHLCEVLKRDGKHWMYTLRDMKSGETIYEPIDAARLKFVSR